MPRATSSGSPTHPVPATSKASSSPTPSTGPTARLRPTTSRRSLGTCFSEAFAINAHGQVVGVSFGGASGSRAFVWQNDALTNLNDLVDIAPDVLVSAQDINDAGQITGRVRDGVTGEILAFVATPIAN